MIRRVFLSGVTAALTGGAGLHAQTVAERWPPLGAFVEIDGLPVHYWDQGQGQPVILIHGASGNLRDFTFSLAPRLAAKFRVIAFDRPGFGYSARLPRHGWDPSVQAAHLARAASALGIRKPIVLGHSWGGALAMAWAVADGAQLQGVASLSGATIPWGGNLSRFYNLFYNLAASDLAGPATAWLVERLLSEARITGLVADTFAPQQIPDGYGAYIGGPLATRARTLRANARDLIELNAQLEQQATHYPEVVCPVEILHGTADETTGHQVHAVPMHQRLPFSTLTLMEGIGHMPHHTNPDDVEAALTRLAER